MRYPEFLKNNQTIGIIAPSFGCTTEPYLTGYKTAIQNFKNLGYSIVEGPNCHKAEGFGKSNTPKACGDEVNDFFLYNRSDVIISCGGGETMNEDLPYIDFEKIRKAPPKWFMGFSDNTNLTFLLPTLCDTAAIYGPNIAAFCYTPWHKCFEDAHKLLRGEQLSVSNYDGWERESLRDEDHPVVPLNITEPYQQVLAGTAKENGSFSGRLLGGCLDVLFLLAGTKYDKVGQFLEQYKDDGVIWFLEACDLNVMSIRRALWRLMEAGWFQNAKGFLIGRSRLFEDTFGEITIKDAYLSMLKPLNVPIVLDVDLGHVSPAMPLISGALADVSTNEGEISVEMRLL